MYKLLLTSSLCTPIPRIIFISYHIYQTFVYLSILSFILFKMLSNYSKHSLFISPLFYLLLINKDSVQLIVFANQVKAMIFSC